MAILPAQSELKTSTIYSWYVCKGFPSMPRGLRVGVIPFSQLNSFTWRWEIKLNGEPQSMTAFKTTLVRLGE